MATRVNMSIIFDADSLRGKLVPIETAIKEVGGKIEVLSYERVESGKVVSLVKE